MSLEIKENHVLCLYSCFFQIVKRPEEYRVIMSIYVEQVHVAYWPPSQSISISQSTDSSDMYGSLSKLICVCNAYITFNNDQRRVLFKIAIKLDILVIFLKQFVLLV